MQLSVDLLGSCASAYAKRVTPAVLIANVFIHTETRCPLFDASVPGDQSRGNERCDALRWLRVRLQSKHSGELVELAKAVGAGVV